MATKFVLQRVVRESCVHGLLPGGKPFRAEILLKFLHVLQQLQVSRRQTARFLPLFPDNVPVFRQILGQVRKDVYFRSPGRIRHTKGTVSVNQTVQQGCVMSCKFSEVSIATLGLKRLHDRSLLRG